MSLNPPSPAIKTLEGNFSLAGILGSVTVLFSSPDRYVQIAALLVFGWVVTTFMKCRTDLKSTIAESTDAS